jgi:archaellum biogenesis protein FlaJ (TadC family)
LTIINTSIALFGGITFGISFAIYVSLIIGRHLNNIMGEVGNPFNSLDGVNVGGILYFIDPNIYNQNFLIIFFVLVVHCFMLAYTLRLLRGGHVYVTLLFFVPFVWIVSITSLIVEVYIGGMLGAS